MTLTKCPKCKGKGTLAHIDWFLGAITFGMTALMQLSDPDQCDACHGKGYVKDGEYSL